MTLIIEIINYHFNQFVFLTKHFNSSYSSFAIMTDILNIDSNLDTPKNEKKAGLDRILSCLAHGEVTSEERILLQKAELMEIRFERKKSLIIVVMDLPAILTDDTLKRIEVAAVKAIPGMTIKIERFEREFNSTEIVTEDALKENWESVVSGVKSKMTQSIPWLLVSQPQLKAETLNVVCADSIAAGRLTVLKCGDAFLQEINKRWQGVKKIKFVEGSLELPLPEKKKVRSSKQKSFELLAGAEFPLRADSMKIQDIATPVRYAVIQGSLFNINIREGRKRVFTAGVTNNEDSIRVKLFEPPEKISELRNGDYVKVGGKIESDTFMNNELCLSIRDIARLGQNLRIDKAVRKRIEFNCHTKLSRLNGLIDIEGLINTAKRWGWDKFVLTDDSVVQAFPKLYSLSKSAGIQMGLGCQINFVDDTKKIFKTQNSKFDKMISGSAVVFDLETTGLSANSNKVIEVGAYRVEKGRLAEEFHSFVNSGEKLSPVITKLTGINDEMLVGAPEWKEVLEKFRKFIGDSVLIAHNADFDAGFLRKHWPKKNEFPPLADTLGICRALLPRIKNFQLGTIAKELKVPLVEAHRAVEDARALARIWLELCVRLKDAGITKFAQLNELIPKIEAKRLHSNEAVLIAKNRIGLKNLYRIVTASHFEHFYIRPRVPSSLVNKLREGLLLGSGATEGPIFDSIVRGDDKKEIERIAKNFDYLEIAPPDLYSDKLAEGIFNSEDEIHELIRVVIELGKKMNKPVIAVSKAYHLESHLSASRKIVRIQKSHNLPSHHLRTTDEMLESFSFLGKELAEEVVIDAPSKLFDTLEDVSPLPKGFFPPIIDGADVELQKVTIKKASELYGGKDRKFEDVPDIIKNSIEKELKAIIGNGFAVLYLIAMRLVKSSLKNGFVVGSRGSVGSSLVAFLSGITEVNPLPPHYRCSKCGRVEFFTEKNKKGSCGPDLPPKDCCGEAMICDGYEIPFEAFMGWEGNKVPDIDLNFAGEYQGRAMREIEETFGKEYVFRAGTISTLQARNALGIVKKHLEENGITMKPIEMERHASILTEVARTTGQHPGGIVIIPKDKEIYDFMPVQRPANSEESDSITTHFDFHSYEGTVVKVDVLAHEAPTAIRMLHSITQIDPMTVPINDKKLLSLFNSPKALGITESRLGYPSGTLGVPEFGTPMAMGILSDTRPETIDELIRISGVSHGEGVWQGNAQTLIKSGSARLSEVIATREDIMNGLIKFGIKPARAFGIMERVRKGKGLTAEDEAEMQKHRVPQWMIDSCKKIRYMFPKAHAAAYVLMSLRIAWFKLYYPAAFYSTWLTINVEDFSYDIAAGGEKAVAKALSEFKKKERERLTTKKEEDKAVVLEIIREMFLRGISLEPVDIRRSDCTKFIVENNSVRAPLLSVQGLGEKAAKKIEKALKEEQILSVEDLITKTSLSRPIAERLKSYGAFGDMPESNQLKLF